MCHQSLLVRAIQSLQLAAILVAPLLAHQATAAVRSANLQHPGAEMCRGIPSSQATGMAFLRCRFKAIPTAARKA
jgi:hypothetical protein